MTISTRLTVLETKLNYFEKLLWVMIIGMGTHLGIDVLPIVTALG